ncbi:MAG: peptidoglycan-binding protein, partial [Hominilimicola sp.]
MKNISIVKRISAIILSFIICCVFTESTAFALSKIGSRGQEVTNIQTRLKNWGYYTWTVDGIYGWRTANAVKEFQRKNGLTADGIAGPATLAKIGLPTGQSTSSNNDVTLLAMVIN